jgi:hypothetical protein
MCCLPDFGATQGRWQLALVMVDRWNIKSVFGGSTLSTFHDAQAVFPYSVEDVCIWAKKKPCDSSNLFGIRKFFPISSGGSYWQFGFLGRRKRIEELYSALSPLEW